MLFVSSRSFVLIAALMLCAAGCRSGKQPAPRAELAWSPPQALRASKIEDSREIQPAAHLQATEPNTQSSGDLGPELSNVPPTARDLGVGDPLSGNEEAEELLRLPPAVAAEAIPQPEGTSTVAPLVLEEVVVSVRNHFPLIQQAAAGRAIASGEILSAQGAFDHKLEGFSESQPLDFYENYRQELGVKRETYWGGQTFAKYRNGRGIFEPWYLERETNKGGEFKAGFMAPIIRDRWIDANRAELWRAQLERRRVEPEILAQVIVSVRDGSVAYWNWVAAGANYRVAEGLLELAELRTEGLQAQVEVEEKAEIDLVDNRRIIVSREAKLIEARRKLEQAAVKLSLFLRTPEGLPLLTDASTLPEQLPAPGQGKLGEVDGAQNEQVFAAESTLLPNDVDLALGQRPELSELQIARRQLNVALRQACNELKPDVDAGVLVGQDVGEPTSSKRDKSELELEALITLSVPLERSKARGKIRSLRGKLASVSAKTRFASDKIVASVQMARAAMVAAVERVQRATESYELAQQMLKAERELFENGQSDLFKLNAREKQAAEAAVERIGALFEYHVARADYAAAMGFEGPLP